MSYRLKNKLIEWSARLIALALVAGIGVILAWRA